MGGPGPGLKILKEAKKNRLTFFFKPFFGSGGKIRYYIPVAVALAAVVGCLCWVIVDLVLSRSAGEVVMAVASVLTSLVAAFGLCTLAILRTTSRVVSIRAPPRDASVSVREGAAVYMAVSETSPPKVVVFEPPES